MKLLVLKRFIYNQSEFQAAFMEIKGSLIALCLLHPAKILLSVLFRRALHTLGRQWTNYWLSGVCLSLGRDESEPLDFTRSCK